MFKVGQKVVLSGNPEQILTSMPMLIKKDDVFIVEGNPQTLGHNDLYVLTDIYDKDKKLVVWEDSLKEKIIPPILHSISMWCDFDPEDCALKKSRYDNCRCAQQAKSVEELLNSKKDENEC